MILLASLKQHSRATLLPSAHTLILLKDVLLDEIAIILFGNKPMDSLQVITTSFYYDFVVKKTKTTYFSLVSKLPIIDKILTK